MLKKYILILLFPISLFAQDNFTLLDKSTMETSILYDRAFKVADIQDHSKKINATYFIQAYSELAKSDYDNHFENIEVLKKATIDGFRERYIPIGIVHTKFDVLKSNVFEDGLITLDANNKLISNVSSDVSLFETHNRTLVSPVSKKWKGLQCTFKIIPELITNSTGNDIVSIKANFNNGLGPQSISINQNISVNYQSEGNKQIDFEITFEDGSIAHNRAFIVIKPSNVDLNTRAPGDEGPITPIDATIPYQGFGEAIPHIGTGEYKIYYDNVDGILDKPIFYVDGFDPGDSRDILGMFSNLNFGNPVQNLADLVRDQGFDVVVLNFPTYVSSSDNVTVIDGGADFIQRNAFILAELIDLINADKVGTAQNVIIGPSMGGLVSRYALRYMELNAMTHDMRLFLSFDSPHLGANVPIGIQYLFNFMINGDPALAGLQGLEGIYNTAAAKQMIIDHFLAHVDGGGILQDPTKTLPMGAPNFRDAFQSEIDGMGFPQNTRNVSVINGSKLGTETGTSGMTALNHTFDTGVVGGFPTQAIIDLKFTPPSLSTIQVAGFQGQVFFGIWVDAFTPFTADAESPSFSDGMDSASGGQFFLGGFDDGSDPLITEFVANLTIQYFDFIPAVSAMAMDISGNGEIDWHYVTNQLGDGSPPAEAPADVINSTPFVNWYMPDANQVHVSLTEGMNGNVQFALDEIFSETLGIATFENTTIQLEKNPVQNELNILTNKPLQKANLILYDISGREVHNVNLGNTTERISVPIHLNSGLYILKLTSDSGSFTTKLVVE